MFSRLHIGASRNAAKIAALAALWGAGVCFLDALVLPVTETAFAQSKESDSKASETKSSDKSKKKSDKKVDKAASDFPEESEESSSFMPDIYRCPECGYEQDEEGVCPDHSAIALVKVISQGRDPLSPVEYDGNEDIIVDVPLRNLSFGKEAVDETADDADVKDTSNKAKKEKLPKTREKDEKQ